MAHHANAALLLLLSLMVAAFVSPSAAESHFETYTFYATESRLKCEQRSSRSCGGWFWGRSCSTNYWTECWTVLEAVLRQGRKCQTGWTSALCDVPICTTPCIDGKVCTAPNTCTCVSTGDGCLSVPCNSENNCYPGSCVSSTCACPSGFSGANCLTIEKTPDISVCMVQLYNSSTALFKEVACEAPGTEPQTTTWISAKTLSKVQVKWTSNYVLPFSLPDRKFAPHVGNSPVPIGVSETGFTISFSGTGTPTSCAAASPNSPQGTVNCDVPRDWVDYGVTPVHNQTFRVDVSSKLGGHKDGANSATIAGSNFPPQFFTGTSVKRSALFKFDLVAPVHCTSFSNNCSIFAIYLEHDITTNPTIEPKFYNWMDDGSGISNFHVEIYFMQPGAQNLLVNVGTALIQSNILPLRRDFDYVCTTSGVYSIELTVEDQAGNYAKARKLFIYNKDSKLTTNPNKPIYIMEADADNGHKWINNFEDPKNGGKIPLTLVWTGHFSSSTKFDDAWGLPAEPWNAQNWIDDKFQEKYGRRSRDALTNMPGGIVSYGVAYVVDEKGGGKGLVPDSWTTVRATEETYSLPISNLTDGNTIVIWLQSADFAGGNVTEKIIVGVDRTAPEVKEASFVANGVDESTSRVSIRVSDVSSGIQNISFDIYDSKLKNKVYSGSSAPQKRDPPSSAPGQRKKRLVPPCTVNDTSCYCIPTGQCYNYIQTVDIDNCWLDRLQGHTLEFRFTVTNGANIKTSEQIQPLGELTLQCRRYQPPIAGIVIGCILGFLLLVALIILIVLLIMVKVFKKPLPRRLVSARDTIQNKFGRPRLDENIAYSSADDFHRNNIQQVSSKPNKWDPASMASKLEGTYVYNSGNGSDEYMSSADAASNALGCPKVIPRKQLKVGETIAEGRFAVIRKAQLMQGNESIPVATKGLIRGFSDADANLMADKINFHSKIPSHVNVVKFLGRLEDTPESGPVMVLEYCETSLKEWLDTIDKINSDVLEDMLIFTLNIAHGVKHLHENQVIHRRLGARNVVLKPLDGGIVAKLIGFGPNREDVGGEQTSLPIKWLAPETLGTLKSGSPTYDKKSDAWSFGITIWEIYSKGGMPYPDLQSDKVNKLLTKEKRMVLSRPEACPVDLFQNALAPCWNFTASKRPSFLEICSKIETFRKGSGQDPLGYYSSHSPGSRPYSEIAGLSLYDDAA